MRAPHRRLPDEQRDHEQRPRARRPPTTTRERRGRAGAPARRRATKRTDERDRRQHERDQDEQVAVPQGVEDLADRAAVRARRGASPGGTRTTGPTRRPRPNGSAATTYTATAIPAATAASRTPVRRPSAGATEQHDQPGDHHRGHRQRLDRHRAAAPRGPSTPRCAGAGRRGSGARTPPRAPRAPATGRRRSPAR